MSLVQNFPFFSIFLCIFGGVVTSVLNKKAARRVTLCISAIVFLMSATVWHYTLSATGSYSFMMGHFPAPFGNEIRIGRLEAVMATLFSFIMFMTLLSGLFNLDNHAQPQKQNLFFVMVDLSLAALLVMLYTNDLFTAYVFIEIMTIASCALIMVRQNGHTLVSATRYMIMNLLASGITLLGISMLYGITGHLLMPQLKQAVSVIHQRGLYSVPLTVVVLLLTVGLSIKSALFPFHSWAPDAYGNAPPVSAAILSGLVSKGYIFLLIKIFYRVIGMDVVRSQHILEVLFVFGIAGMLIGSVSAVRQRDIRRMVAYSSVAQIGYVFMGIGMGTAAGTAAALFHMVAHAAAKPVLFISSAALTDASGDHKRFHFLHGAGYRCKAAGVSFSITAMSMVGIPLTAGFISKVRLSLAGMVLPDAYRFAVLFTLAISTLLNAVYFLHTVVSVYRKASPEAQQAVPCPLHPMTLQSKVSLVILALLTLILGVLSGPVMQSIFAGLRSFS
ncbi:MAG: proton-conducting transporter membrane subunit [Eubacteriales bacterium]|nr:proton-conducting transporter membrane subunit [Eubacteriales bacterium]MDD4104362.1 proton-conducting transporter membrane subunit [Eubacteriales bacterium]MDD4709691.1 proton-conducting transporter membrane subunit [Eubacteriales bacterium]NLO15208.1 sodium:proton antiporter [Clostridiales bacterium]